LRIAILTPSYFHFYKGAERIIHSLSKGLAQKGHQIFLLCPKYCSPVGDERGVKVLPILQEGWDRNLPINSLIVFNILSSIKVDLLNIHFAYPFGLIGVVCKLRLGLPYVVTSHGGDIQIDRHTQYGARIKLRAAFQIWLTLKLADAHIIVGKHMLIDAISAGSNPSRVFWIPPGIPPPSRYKKALKPLSPQIKKDDIVILFIGRLIKKKGVMDLIKASPSVLEKIPKAKFVIAGEGKEHIRLVKYSKQLGVSDRVLFLGEVSEEQKIALLQRADIYVSPSYKEGSSLSLLEAMTYGKALVLSRIPSSIELVNDSDAIFFERGNIVQLAKAIIGLAESPQRIRLLSHRVARKALSYHESTMVSKYEEIFRSVISMKTRSAVIAHSCNK
jgi:1,2-diacylglycerol 3-alpha-glucosyltransferase